MPAVPVVTSIAVCRCCWGDGAEIGPDPGPLLQAFHELKTRRRAIEAIGTGKRRVSSER